jgi:hypothetical protein
VNLGCPEQCKTPIPAKFALDLASDCHRAYLQADDRTRRLLNQALFDMIYIDEDGVRAALTEPFKTLLGPASLWSLTCPSVERRRRRGASRVLRGEGARGEGDADLLPDVA